MVLHISTETRQAFACEVRKALGRAYAHGLTQEDVGREIGISAQTLRDWSNGTIPAKRRAKRAAVLLGVMPQFFPEDERYVGIDSHAPWFKLWQSNQHPGHEERMTAHTRRVAPWVLEYNLILHLTKKKGIFRDEGKHIAAESADRIMAGKEMT